MTSRITAVSVSSISRRQGLQARLLEHGANAVQKRLAIEFDRRDVHRYSFDRQAGADPGTRLGTGFAQYPLPDGFDEPGILRDRDEVTRGYQAVGGPLPADQCLDAFDFRRV